jgi:hypothetical protein
MDRKLSTDDDINSTTATYQLLDTFYINIIIFSILVLIFECSRGIKSLFLNRLLVRRLVEQGKVPKQPSFLPFAWVFVVIKCSDDDVRRMVGYVPCCTMQYIKI